MIRIAIVEDDKNYVEVLKRYIARYEEESKNRFSVTVFQDGEDIIENYSADYDIILLDILMHFTDGMTAAEEIRKNDSEVVIIFITSTPQYVMKGYAVEALDYVLKPINYYAFSQRIDRALGRMERRKKKYLSISQKGRVKKLELSSIYYIEVQDHDLYFHTKEGVFSQRGTMKEIEQRLAEDGFFRCNKCYLVNLEYVDGFEDSCVIVDGEEILVSRARKKELLDVLNDYMSEVAK